MIERMEGVRQVICIGRHHQRTIFICGLLHGIGEARDLLDQFDLMFGQFIVKSCRLNVLTFERLTFFKIEFARTCAF